MRRLVVSGEFGAGGRPPDLGYRVVLVVRQVPRGPGVGRSRPCVAGVGSGLLRVVARVPPVRTCSSGSGGEAGFSPDRRGDSPLQLVDSLQSVV